jgi:hypothetical protein
MRMTMPVSMAAVAIRTAQSLSGHVFDQCQGGVLRSATAQQGDAGQALAAAQGGELGDEGFPLGWLHGRLPFV